MLANREELIARIVKAARKDCPEIVERRTLYGNDGLLYNATGFPSNVDCAGEGPSYYIYLNPDGHTFGRRANTRLELIDEWNAHQDYLDKEFKRSLEIRTDKLLQQAADFWLRKKTT